MHPRKCSGGAQVEPAPHRPRIAQSHGACEGSPSRTCKLWAGPCTAVHPAVLAGSGNRAPGKMPGRRAPCAAAWPPSALGVTGDHAMLRCAVVLSRAYGTCVFTCIPEGRLVAVMSAWWCYHTGCTKSSHSTYTLGSQSTALGVVCTSAYLAQRSLHRRA